MPITNSNTLKATQAKVDELHGIMGKKIADKLGDTHQEVEAKATSLEKHAETFNRTRPQEADNSTSCCGCWAGLSALFKGKPKNTDTLRDPLMQPGNISPKR
jgi:hypothetical protein